VGPSTLRQLGLPLHTTAEADATEFLHGRRGPLPVRFGRHARARRYVLRVDADGVARVTMPRWGKPAEARAFAEAHVDWIERQRARQLQASQARPATVLAGSPVLLDGVPHPLRVEPHEHGIVVGIGPHERITAVHADFRHAAAAMLRDVAREALPPRLLELAAEHGHIVTAVTIRNQRTRWGSCTSTGRISLNWRLVQMPPAVRDYVLLHELMHLRVRNHSPRFWQQVARVCPQVNEARRWLREHGPELL
jgi:predicted metal-dependent hydrolase